MNQQRHHWGGDTRLWPVLLLLFVTVLAPTAGVLWFMAAAARNERLAVREKFAQLYRGHLLQVQAELEGFTRRLSNWAVAAVPAAPAAAFEQCLAAEIADAAIVLDDEGAPAYPGKWSPPAALPNLPEEWDAAERLEFDERDYALAAVSFAGIARLAEDPQVQARALRAQVRCLLRAGQVEQAANVALEKFGQPDTATALDEFGRRIAADAELAVAERLPADDARREALVERLRKIAGDYTTNPIPSAQRRFLLRRLCDGLGQPLVAQLAAEERAAAAAAAPPENGWSHQWRPAGIADVWQFSPEASPIVWLIRTERLQNVLGQHIAAARLPSDVKVVLLSPGQSQASAFVTTQAGATLPGWQLALSLQNENELDIAERQGVVLYVWTGIVMVAVVAVLALCVAAALRRQLQMTRLKNDLVATVSHELKTPLASMRLLVDTLLDAPSFNASQVREYLQLVAQENSRLARLIDNFLAFQRMTRAKWTFVPTSISVEDVVASATAAVAERLTSPGCRFETIEEVDVPPVMADADALTTALVNLLDNALKYTGENKQITLRVSREGNWVSFAVSDNGMGIAPRAARRIFEPFYQVDQRLARTAGGCGLGLAIVQRIADGHGGKLRVESQPGVGSTFTLTLPAAGGAAAARSGEHAHTTT